MKWIKENCKWIKEHWTSGVSSTASILSFLLGVIGVPGIIVLCSTGSQDDKRQDNTTVLVVERVVNSALDRAVERVLAEQQRQEEENRKLHKRDHQSVTSAEKTTGHQDIQKPVHGGEGETLSNLPPPNNVGAVSPQAETKLPSSEDHRREVQVAALEENPPSLKNVGLPNLLHERIFVSASSKTPHTVAAALGARLRDAGFQTTSDRRDAAVIIDVAIQNLDELPANMSGEYTWTAIARLEIRATRASDKAVLLIEPFEGKGQADGLDTAQARALLAAIGAGVHRFQAEAELQR